MSIQNVDESGFDAEVLQSSEPVIVDFYADWCGPCKALAPVLADLAKEYDGRVKVVKVNIDKNMSLAAAYGVQSIPYVAAFSGGKVVDSQAGFGGKGKLEPLFEGLVE